MSKVNALDPEYEKYISELEKNESVNLPYYSGINNEFTPEVKPEIIQAGAEVVYKGKTNCFIMLGSDRPGAIGTGYGRAGEGGSATIDIVAGHLGKRTLNKTAASKNIDLDSARLYISQKTDVDINFGIPQYGVELGNVSLALENSTGRSAFAGKADCVRLIARDNIKLVTQHLSDTSLDGSKFLGGIDIIAGCDVPGLAPQPMVKGNNLLEALVSIIDLIGQVQNTLSNFMDEQNQINNIMMGHTHMDSTGHLTMGVVANTALKNISNIARNIIPEILTTNMNFEIVKQDYLSAASEKYINSAFNRVN